MTTTTPATTPAVTTQILAADAPSGLMSNPAFVVAATVLLVAVPQFPTVDAGTMRVGAVQAELDIDNQVGRVGDRDAELDDDQFAAAVAGGYRWAGRQ
mgnify:CR=1 FL=1